MKIPNSALDEFHFKMDLLFDCFSRGLIEKVPAKLFRKLSVDEKTSLFVGLLDIDKEEK